MGSRAAARAKRQARRKKVSLASGQTTCAAENVSESKSATFAFASNDPPASPELPTSPELPASAVDLSPKQQMAVAALVLGGNVTRTAEEIGVDRRTIQRWMKDDPQFHEVLESMRWELVVCARQNLLELAECSAKMVEALFVERPCPRLALNFMRGLGALGPDAAESLYHPPHVTMDLEAKSTETKNAHHTKSATLAAAAEETPTQETLDQEPPVQPQAEPAADRKKPSGDARRLSPAQLTVLENLSHGETISNSAFTARVSETEVRHWLHCDQEFCQQLSELQYERIDTLRGNLFKLLHKALDILQKAILAGNSRIALALLRGLGLMK